MAAFSNYEESNMNPFLVDSVYLQNQPMSMKMIMSGFMEDHGTNMVMHSNCLPHIYPPETEPVVKGTTAQTALAHESSCLDHNSKVALSDDNEPSVTRKQSSESSTVVDKLESGEQVTQKLITPIDNKRKPRNGFASAQSMDAREKKGRKQKQCIGEAKVKQQQKSKADKQDKKKTDQEPPTGYIHVRARRGQATDSHSLAERVRREKISERMKILQKLVPGCDKVTGKALMLDEIINYVQSLQNQVEFLSMKLASVNPMFYDFGMDQDSLIFRPSERLNFQTSPVPQCSPNQPTVFADTQPQVTTTTTTTTATAPNNTYTLVPGAFSQIRHVQDNASLLWDVEEQGQKFLNPSGFNDNLCSFN